MMFDAEMLSRLQKRMEEVTGIKIPCRVKVLPGAGLRVDWEGSVAAVRAEDVSALCRALFLLSAAAAEGRSALHTEERRHFAHCGAMLDMSRNRVMTVEGVKRWIDRQAALGLNLLMLYTEDTYEIPEYPYFGYLRGRYSRQELKEIDDYAFSMGVELIPCIQTLGHMAQFLQWPSSAPLVDQPRVLMIDEEGTYAFLEAALRSLSGCFRSRRIHIGMDEAHGVGLGNYLLKHGYADRFELLNRHLARVVSLCEKYGFKPMMWSDMFFRLGSKTNAYYDLNSHLPEAVIASLPQVEMVYWDYYHTDEAFYEHMLEEHLRMKRNAVFAGGVWTWSGFLPNREKTLRSMLPALRINARKETDTVLATMWGDDGAETDYLMAVDRLTLFSEACWKGEGFTVEEADRLADHLTRTRLEIRQTFDAFYADSCDKSTGKALLWCDPLYPCGVSAEQKEILKKAAEQALRVLESKETLHGKPLDEKPIRGNSLQEEPLRGKGVTSQDADPSALQNVYVLAVFRTLVGKIRLIQAIRAAYEKKDKAALADLADKDIPALADSYIALMYAHGALWESNSKRQGWEVLSLRYGGAVGRLEDVGNELKRYAEGTLACIPELDEKELPDGKGSGYDRVSTPSAKT